MIMNYKNLFKQMSLAMVLALGFAACSEEDAAVFENTNRFPVDSLIINKQEVYNMHLDCAPPDFEGQTTRATTDWDNGSIIYLKLGSTYGTAVYNKASGVWTVTANGSLATTTTNQTCTAYYFEGTGSASTSSVELKATTAIYQGTGTYTHPTADDVYVSAKLSPLTWRLCFKERSVTLNGSKSDIKYYSSFNPANHNMPLSQMGEVSLSNGQYVYGTFAYTGSTENTVAVTTDNTYTRTIKGNQLSAKESGTLTAPTSSNYGTLGWKKDVDYTFDAQPTSLSFEAAAASKTVSVTGNDTWTASSSASWCTLSRSSDSGPATITVSVSQNSSSSAREATITLKGQNTQKTVTIGVNQKGNTPNPYIDDCKLTPLDFVAFTNGFTTDWTAEANVSYSYITVFSKAYYNSISSNENAVIEAIKEDNTSRSYAGIVNTFHNDTFFSPATEYVLCTISYNNAGERGELVVYPFTTMSTSMPLATISNLRASTNSGTNIWEWDMILTNNATAYYLNLTENDSWYSNSNDYYLAWLMHYWITSGQMTTTYDFESVYIGRSGTKATCLAWAVNASGTLGNYSLSKASTSSSARFSEAPKDKLNAQGRPVPQYILKDTQLLNSGKVVLVMSR